MHMKSAAAALVAAAVAVIAPATAASAGTAHGTAAVRPDAGHAVAEVGQDEHTGQLYAVATLTGETATPESAMQSILEVDGKAVTSGHNICTSANGCGDDYTASGMITARAGTHTYCAVAKYYLFATQTSPTSTARSCRTLTVNG